MRWTRTELSANRDLTIYYVLSQCIVYWTYFQNIHTFIYQKHYFLHFFTCSENWWKPCILVSCILKNKYNFTSDQKTLFHIDYQSISIDQNNIFSNILYIYHKMEVTWTYFWYISWSPNSLQPLNHLTPRIYDIVPSLSWLEKHLIFDQSCF